MKRTFTYTDEKSNKFWTIEVSGSNYTVNYGKAGTAGQTQTKDFVDEAACRKAADKLIAEKIKKGYTEDGNSEIGSQKAEKTNNNEQRYFDHESHISIEEVMGRLRDWSDNYEAVEHFNEYYEENYNDCYATTDGKTITFTWCDLDDDKLEKSICIIDPNAKKATLIPSSDNEYIQEEMDGEKELSIGFPEDFLDIIKQECKNWKGEHDGKPFPFPKLPKRPKAKYAFELPSFTVEKRKGDSIPDISKFYSYRYCPNDEEWVIHTPKEKQIILRAKGKKFKMFFDTNEKAIATACKIVMKRMIVDKARFSDDDKAFTLADVKQTVYLYEKQQQGGTAGSYATTVYDPTSHGLIFLEAIRTGNTDFVKLCLENGANPVESIEIKKSQSRRPMSLAIEVNQPEILKMLIKHAFNYYNNSRQGDGTPLSILSSIAINEAQGAELQMQMLLDCGYDCVKDAESIIIYAHRFNTSAKFTQMILDKVKEGVPGIRRILKKGGVFWKVDTIEHFLQTTYGKTGTFGQIQMQLYNNKKYEPDTDACQKAAEEMIAKKLKDGYTEITGNDAQDFINQRNNAEPNPNQRYFSSNRQKAVEDLLERLEWSAEYKKLLQAFNAYCKKNYKECFVTTTDGTTFAYNFCNLDKNTMETKGNTDILKVDIKNKKLTFIPSVGNTDVYNGLKGNTELTFPIEDEFAIEITLERNFMKWTGEEDGSAMPYNHKIHGL